jgi:hypothetical protein
MSEGSNKLGSWKYVRVTTAAIDWSTGTITMGLPVPVIAMVTGTDRLLRSMTPVLLIQASSGKPDGTEPRTVSI